MPKRKATTEDTIDPAGADLPPLVMLRAFEATIRTGSMRRAAYDVGVSHTVVSRHVRHLEHWLGTKLVSAGPRGVVPTAHGRMFYESVERAFRLIAEAAAELRPVHRGGVLRIWCIPGLATRWLTPRLSELEAALPGTEIVVRATDETPDLSRRQAHLVIGYGDADALPPGAIPIVRPRIFPIASPAWLAKHGRPRTLAELSRLPLVHEESHRQWQDWFRAAGARQVDRLRGPRLSDANLAFDAAMAGQGVALATSMMTTREIANGQLVELFDTRVHLGGYYVHAAAGRPDRRVDTLVRWLTQTMRTLPDQAIVHPS